MLLSHKLKLLSEGSQTNTSASFSSLTTCRPTSVSYLRFLALPSDRSMSKMEGQQISVSGSLNSEF